MAKIVVEEKANRFRDIRGRFAALTGRGVAEHSREHMREVGRILIKALSQEAPDGKPDPLGRPPPPEYRKLRQNIRFRTYIRGNSMILRVYAPPQYIWTTRGTKPHPIPKSPLPYPLHFWWGRMNKEVWFWHINHPGYRGDRWDRRAMDRVREDLRAEMRKGITHVNRMFRREE